MLRHFLPTYVGKNVFSISASFYERIGKKAILFDLDNTLDPVNVKEPSTEVAQLVSSLKEKGFAVYVASNNTGRRVSQYCEKLGIESTSGLLKPLSYKLKRWIKSKGYLFDEVILVGDQIFTDVLAAKGAKIDVILTEPISKKDSIFTFFNRKIEGPIRRKIEKRHLVPRWEEMMP